MRKYLFILICLPLFAQVPDTNTFSFTDVKDEIEDNGGATTNSLVDAFTNANASGFDPAYEGSKNSLLNFRNYTHCGVPFNQDFDTTTQTGSPTSIFINSSEDKLYLMGGSNVYYYTITTGDLSTISYQSSFNTGFQDANNRYFTFNTTASKMYVVSINNDIIFQYSVSSGTITYDSVSASISTQIGGNTPRDLSLSNNNRLYVLSSSEVIYQYNLSTASNLSTMSYSGLSFNTSTLGTVSNITKIFVKNDGTKIYLIDSAENIYECDLGTAYNISTLTYNGINTADLGQVVADQPFGVHINTAGDKLYLTSQPDKKIYQFDVTCPWEIH